MTDPIYLDHNATTPVAAEVFAAMAPWLQEHFGNPSSSHAHGRRAAQAVAHARGQVAALIGALPQEIVFNGCAIRSGRSPWTVSMDPAGPRPPTWNGHSAPTRRWCR